MRGRQDPQASMLAFIDTESRIPPDDPLRTIKYMADESLTDLSPLFDDMYAEIGRPSIRPERLLKAWLLISLYSVRSVSFVEERRHRKAMLGIILDISDEVAARRQAAHAQAELHAFLFSLCHEIKSPHFVIKGHAQVLRRQLAPRAEAPSAGTAA